MPDSYPWKDDSDWLDKVNHEIAEIMLSYLPYKDRGEYYTGLTDYIVRGGHLTRPKLMLLTARALGADLDSRLMLLAASIELAEVAILKYDDIQDHSIKRRGIETTNHKYGNEKAINFAAALHDKSRQMFEDYLLSLEDRGIAARIKSTYDNIADTTAYGQHLELDFMYSARNFSVIEARMRAEGRPYFDLYYDIVKGKTCAYSVWGPMQLGAIAAGKGDKVLEVIKEIGIAAGIAFQINDDIEDALNFRKDKAKNGDLKEGKYTLIMAHAYRNATQEERDFIDSLYAKPRSKKTEEDIATVKSIVYRTESIKYALNMRDRYMDTASEMIKRYEDLIPHNEHAAALEMTIVGLLHREGIDLRAVEGAKLRSTV